MNKKNKTTTSISESMRENLIRDILDSEIDNPGIVKSEWARRMSSQNIAAARHLSPLQVGGVRSNLNANRYGSKKHMKTKRKHERGLLPVKKDATASMAG